MVQRGGWRPALQGRGGNLAGARHDHGPEVRCGLKLRTLLAGLHVQGYGSRAAVRGACMYVCIAHAWQWDCTGQVRVLHI